MTKTEHDAGFSAAVASIVASADGILSRRALAEISEDEITAALTALGKLYSAKIEQADKVFPPVNPDALTATETVVLVSELLRSADLNVFDLAMWFRRAS